MKAQVLSRREGSLFRGCVKYFFCQLFLTSLRYVKNENKINGYKTAEFIEYEN